MRNTETHEASRTLSLQERAEILEEYLAQASRRGWRLEGKGDYIAFLVSGKPVNHKRHALTALLTAGLWLPVWAGMSIFGGEKRMLVRVDGAGEPARAAGTGSSPLGAEVPYTAGRQPIRERSPPHALDRKRKDRG